MDVCVSVFTHLIVLLAFPLKTLKSTYISTVFLSMLSKASRQVLRHISKCFKAYISICNEPHSLILPRHKMLGFLLSLPLLMPFPLPENPSPLCYSSENIIQSLGLMTLVQMAPSP